LLDLGVDERIEQDAAVDSYGKSRIQLLFFRNKLIINCGVTSLSRRNPLEEVTIVLQRAEFLNIRSVKESRDVTTRTYLEHTLCPASHKKIGGTIVW
jgi:hypothetical protein